jgi:hypothetical protein
MEAQSRKKRFDFLHHKYEESIEQMCDMMLDSIREGYQNNLEPWDVYEQKVRAEAQQRSHQFQERVLRGFRVLLQEINNSG